MGRTLGAVKPRQSGPYADWRGGFQAEDGDMARDRRADPNCPHCHGLGAVVSSEAVDENGELWCNWLDCICLPINPISEEMRRVLDGVSDPEGTKQ